MKPVTPILTVHLMGGLGNQLFQYAFGRTLARANEAELVLDASGYAKYGPADPDAGVRKCELQHFRIVGQIIGSNGAADIAAQGPVLRRKTEKARRFLRNLMDLPRPYYMRHEIVEPSGGASVFDSRVRSRTFAGSLSVRGFWQSERYFKRSEPELRRELIWRSTLPQEDAELAEMIGQTVSVAVHVRGGDYAGNPAATPGALPRSYYDAAFEQLLERVPNLHLFVFSDSPSRAQDLLGGSADRTYVVHTNAAEGHRDLRLMALCKHHVIANSTLSWWGAWLGKKDGQVVVAPRKYWQNANRPTPDLYPEDWLLI
jgi:hypothetical protein